ncbi:hypothetical protein BDV28DRAFT_164881 [Aspergillus coremiiformis]|uniref:Glutamyl-tRNA amidotransferase complex subunit Gta3 domain-containing protein n=1 Tax=Aspergillus coremiiformis TaxID=138285 RepID=A0A5N6Z8J1_9EURO|nr:hypothetical protein BDV28DRAFT_164881 [Aspergillus coremiiformis]
MYWRSTERLSGGVVTLIDGNLNFCISNAENGDIDALLAKPSWSVRSLLPDQSTKQSSPSVTPAQLHHLLRLSALPQPSSKEEETKMLETLESQIHFVREIQRADVTGVEPLQSIRDESPEALKENTIGLDQLKEALSKERVVGRNKRIQRVQTERNNCPDGDAWDGNALGYASKTKGKFFVVETVLSATAILSPMWKNLKEKHASKFGSAAPAAHPQSDNNQDLTTILNRSQRADLTMLVAAVLEYMRVTIEQNFDGSSSQSHEPSPEHKESDSTSASHDQQGNLTNPTNRSDVKTTAEDLKAEAVSLTSFDDWRDSVILRIGEAVNKHDDDDQQDSINSQEQQAPLLQGSLEKLREIYPPVETPLIQLPEAKRLLILHSLLLLLLSLEHYSARSRVLMLHIASSLCLDVKALNDDEIKVGRVLLDTAIELSKNAEAQNHVKKSDSSRKWKVGLASVAGAALIGITGGLAAPLVAAGLGTVLGGIGLGATAAAGYLGALAGSGVIVGGLFGAYGGRMTGRMVDKYAREVKDFAFLPVRGSRQGSQDESEAAKQDHRLRVTIGITGWVTDEDNFVVPWRVIGAESEVFGLRWETEPLMNLGNAMDLLVTSAAWVAGEQVLKKTFFASLLSAMVLPLGLLKVASVADNPFSVAKARADKAGQVLADALINKVQGERSVTLIGYSLGSRVIFACLQSLAKRGAYGLVESAILMGSPTPSNARHWRRLRSVVSGRLVNVYSENDAVLALLYRTSSLQLGVAGLQPVQGVVDVENLDASDIISGHLRYQFLVGHILNKIGLESVDAREMEREEAALAAKDRRQEQERVRNERRAGVHGRDSAHQKLESGELKDEEDRLQRQVKERTSEHLHLRPSDQGAQDHPSSRDTEGGI